LDVAQTATAKIAATQMAMKRGKEPWSPYLRETLRHSNQRYLKTPALIQKDADARNLAARRSIANAIRVGCSVQTNACVTDVLIVTSIRNFQKVVLFH
jgi:hypothetical protein